MFGTNLFFLINLPALKGGVSCKRYKIDEVRSVRKLLIVGFITMYCKCYKTLTALKGGVLNPTANKYNMLQKIAFGLIWFYQQAISPHFPLRCRYYPTCSVYTVDSIKKYGFFRGAFLGIRRILRCHPFVRGGYDPV